MNNVWPLLLLGGIVLSSSRGCGCSPCRSWGCGPCGGSWGSCGNWGSCGCGSCRCQTGWNRCGSCGCHLRPHCSCGWWDRFC